MIGLLIILFTAAVSESLTHSLPRFLLTNCKHINQVGILGTPIESAFRGTTLDN